MANGGTFRKIRILILLLVLLFVALSTWLSELRTTDWDRPLWVAIYPINGDDNDTVAGYIDHLDVEDFRNIETFMAEQAQHYGIEIDQPVTVKLAPQVHEAPPKPPQDGNIPATTWWSLRMRYWSHTHDTFTGPEPDIRMFVIYHDPDLHRRLGHSLGLQKGLIGVVNAFAHPRLAGRNNVVIAHEMLHTLGATDKYDPSTNMPLYPIGYADPEQTPLHPQRRAELMAGRIPVSAAEARIPNRLREAMIGPVTAMEIRWVE